MAEQRDTFLGFVTRRLQENCHVLTDATLSQPVILSPCHAPTGGHAMQEKEEEGKELVDMRKRREGGGGGKGEKRRRGKEEEK